MVIESAFSIDVPAVSGESGVKNQKAFAFSFIRAFAVCFSFAITMAICAGAQSTTYSFTGGGYAPIPPPFEAGGIIGSPNPCPITGSFTTANPIPPNTSVAYVTGNLFYNPL